jgi:hypothetical protein
MGVLFQVLGYVGLALVILVLPNIRDLRHGAQEYILPGICLVLIGIGRLSWRLDRVEAMLKDQGQKPT